MHVDISKELAEAAGKGLVPYGINNEKVRWQSTTIDLRHYNNNQVKKLRDIVQNCDGAKGKHAALRDINTWIEAAERGAEKVKCRNTKQFCTLAFEWLQKQPGQRLYKKDEDRDVWCSYHVGFMRFHEKETRRDGVVPAYTRVYFYFMELGKQQNTAESFEDFDVRGLTVPEVFAKSGWLPESKSLRDDYLAMVEKYVEHHDKIGRQFLASGVGTSDLDGNGDDDGHWCSRWYGTDTVQLMRNGEPSRVVIDVIYEGDKEDRDRSDNDNFNQDFWRAKSYLEAADDDEPEDISPGDEDADPVPPPDVPLFPVVPVFDFRRHLRLRVHIANLERYVYDTKLSEKLVLPDDQRRLVDMLVSHKGGFNDVVKGKGGGAIILCAGIPGTGKTLTAEVYAETEERPLYSVQCSQLGTDPDDLEKALLKVFVRSQRWNAILLLDEADVYVAKRGSDLTQNAIVGVFLRVLEYYNGVLFLTTNRAEMVDDAVASRCIARIDYGVPSGSDQRKIWRILADVMAVKLTDATIAEITREHPKLTGRDIKNLLKLAVLVSRTTGEKVDAKTITFVKRFKPTVDDE